MYDRVGWYHLDSELVLVAYGCHHSIAGLLEIVRGGLKSRHSFGKHTALILIGSDYITIMRKDREEIVVGLLLPTPIA